MNKIREIFKNKVAIIGMVSMVAVLLLVLVIVISFNKGEDNNKETTQLTSGTYTIEVVSKGGKPLADVMVCLYRDTQKKDLYNAVRTDETGKITFESDGAIGHTVSIDMLPAGYEAEETYTITSMNTQIVVDTKLLSTDNLSDLKISLGDVFADMSVNAVDGNTYTVSELLKEKKIVVLNFWFLTCEPCKKEFPYLQKAYEAYKDDVAVLALNCMNTSVSDAAKIEAYRDENKISIPMAQCDSEWSNVLSMMQYPTTVVIDRYGTVGMIHSNSVEEEGVFESIFDFFLEDNYKQTTVKNMEDILLEREPDGSENNPYQMTALEFDVKVAPDQILYYQMYKVDGMRLVIKDSNAKVIYNGENHIAKEGVVSVELTTPDTYTPTMFGICNSGVDECTFKVTVEFPVGSLNNPVDLVLGTFETKLEAGNDRGFCYLYTATQNGTLKITCKSCSLTDGYGFSLYNLNTYAMRNMDEDLQLDPDGNGYVTIDVNAGNQVQISVNTLADENNEYPEADFTFEATFKEGTGAGQNQIVYKDYVIKIKDSSGKEIPNVAVTISGDDMTPLTETTDDEGKILTSLKKGTYTVVISVPSGYTLDKTEYTMTEDNTNLDVKLSKVVEIEKVSYEIKVVDELGAVIKDAYVAIGEQMAYTNVNGVAVIKLPKGSYTVSVSKDGYISTTSEIGNKTSVTVKLNAKIVEPEDTTLTYSVNIVDYNGNPLTGAGVNILKDNIVVSGGQVNASGVYSDKLEPGNYTVQVVTGDKYVIEDKEIVLSATKTSVTISALVKFDMSVTETIESNQTIVVHPITAGGYYVQIQENANNYFIFEPTEGGKYRFTVKGETAKIAFAGTKNYILNPSYESNIYETKVDESAVGNVKYIITITGMAEGSLIIEKYADADKPFEWTTYTATGAKPSKNFKAPVGTLTYFDVSKPDGTYNLVKGDDGYYHLNSLTGPIVYVNFGDNAPFISMSTLIQRTSFSNRAKAEDYTALMTQYVNCMDLGTGTYPLTDDLMYMLQNGGIDKGWWKEDLLGGFYLFDEIEENINYAWMFACCYVQ